jgi:hypothetical protein
MNELETKKIVVNHIISHLNPVPAGAANELLQQPLQDLEAILSKLADTREQEQVEEEALARIREAQTERAFDTAWGVTLARVSLNGRYLCDIESNRSFLESLLNSGELPTPAGYSTLVLQFPTKFSWETPQPRKTDADRLAEFQTICRENSLSECAANQQLHKEGVALDAWAGASGLERAAFQAEAQAARQHFLIHDASPTQLKQEAAWESQQNRAAAVQAEADRQHQISSQQQQQSGMFPPLPEIHAETGENIDARWLRKTSTINFELFKKLCRRHGSAAVTERLRIPTTPAV